MFSEQQQKEEEKQKRKKKSEFEGIKDCCGGGGHLSSPWTIIRRIKCPFIGLTEPNFVVL